MHGNCGKEDGRETCCLGQIGFVSQKAVRRSLKRLSAVKAVMLGLEAVADSAGIGSWHVGEAPDRRAQAVACRHGIDISGYRARQVRDRRQGSREGFAHAGGFSSSF